MTGWTETLVGLTLYFCTHLIAGEAPSTLRLINVVFRHGDRSPMSTFPGDLHNESSWPQGFAQLSQEGMRQEFALGEFFRSRYSGFLSMAYKRSEIHVQSTNLDRTLMSAQAVMTGLYPPEGVQQWAKSKALAWQPIPIFAMGLEDEQMLRYDASACPALRKHSQSVGSDPRIRQIEEKYKDLLALIYNNTGATVIGGPNNLRVGTVRDTLFCEHIHNLTLPVWVKVPETLDALNDLKLSWKKVKHCTNTGVIRVTGGQFLKRIVSDMKMVAQKLLDANFKALFYSAHDTTLLALMCALNVFNDKLVPYSSAIMVELHHSQPVDSSAPGWFVQVWYRNDSSRDPFPLTIPGCMHDCPLDRFVNLTSGNIADNWNTECGFFSLNLDSLWRIVLIAVASGFGGLLTLLLLSCCCHRKCNRRHLRTPPTSYGKIRVVDRPEEMPMMSPGGDSDNEA